MNVTIIGLSITSSWGNGHATTYRGLVRELTKRGHNVLFLERNLEWYASNRDMPNPPFGHTELYENFADLKNRFENEIRNVDFVIVGSYVHEGVSIGEWVVKTARGGKAFYDIDTPVTLAKLANDDLDYLSRELVSKYDLYLSFTGGPTLERIETEFGSPMARALYCSVDPELYFPEPRELKWDLGYMGTYSDDRQPALENLMLAAARECSGGKFVVAGPMYPAAIRWPQNVERITHLSPREHRDFYNAQKFTLNITRADMRDAGWSPSVRLFEAAACATPIISDYWDGLDELFETGDEILITRSAASTLHFLRDISETERRAIGEAARKRVLRDHTAVHRAAELETYLNEVLGTRGEETNGAPVSTGEKSSEDFSAHHARAPMQIRPAYAPENYIYESAVT